MKSFYIGLIENNKGNYTLALKYIDDSLSLINDFELNHFHFVVRYNRFVINYNLFDLDAMANDLDILNIFEYKEKYYQNKLRECKLDYNLRVGQVDEALLIVDDALENESDLTERDLVSYYYVLIDTKIRQEDYMTGYNVLQKLKYIKKYKLPSTYYYYKKLLEFLIDRASLTLYSHEFENDSFSRSRLKYLIAFQNNDQQQMKKIWSQIEKQNFAYKTIFSDKYASGDLFVKVYNRLLEEKNKNYSGLTIMEKLYEIFIKNESEISKSDLIFALYGVEPEKEHALKLRKSLYNFKKKHNVEIKLEKGIYTLLIDNSKEAS